MDSNLDEGHAKCVGESSHPRTPWASKCLHEPMPPYFLNIYYLCDPIKCEYGKNKVLLGRIAPLSQNFMRPPQPRELVGWWNIVC